MPIIDRRAVVERHSPHFTEWDAFSPLSVGNGEFCYQTISSKENKPMAKKELTAAARQDEKKINAAIPEVIRSVVPKMLRVLTKL